MATTAPSAAESPVEDVPTAGQPMSFSSSTSSSSAGSPEVSTESLFSKAPALVAHQLQQLTRQRRHFAEFEAGLPDMLSRVSGSSGEPPKSSLPLTVTDKDSVWLLDNVAYVDETETSEASATSAASTASVASGSRWQAEYVVAVLSQQPTSRLGGAVGAVQAVAAAVADRLGGGPVDEATLQTIRQRLRPFLQDVLPGRQVHARHGRDWPLVFSPAGRNGVSSDVQRLPGDAQAAGTLVPTMAEVPPGADGELSMQTLFAEGTGWGVISDIDDTIKVTQTSDPVGILKTTFVDKPSPIAGMPELYRFLAAATAPSAGDGASVALAAPFFYLSASPYNLYPFLRGFRQQYYPHGALLLRDASPTSVAGLLSTLTLDTQDYKVGRMKKVHGWLPRKTFVCIGDSTQSDPEAYGEIYRTFPGWVKLILIRKVTDIAALGLAEKNEPVRFEKAFHDVPTSVWHVFEDPAECYALVQRVVGTPSTAA